MHSHQRPPNGEGYFLYPEHRLPRCSEVGNTLKRAAGFGQESHNFLTEITAQKVTHVGGANCYKYSMAEADVMASVRETPKSDLPKHQGKHRAETHAMVCKSDAAATETCITNDPAALSAASSHISQSSVIAFAEHVYHQQNARPCSNPAASQQNPKTSEKSSSEWERAGKFDPSQQHQIHLRGDTHIAACRYTTLVPG